MKQYREGPWEAMQVIGVRDHHALKPIFSDGLWHIKGASDSDTMTPVCVVDYADDHHEGTRQRAEHTARLIAAAPEMADMLLSMFSHVSHGGPTRAEAEALLKKAGVL